MCLPLSFTMHFFFLPCVKLPSSFLALLHLYRNVVTQRTDSFSKRHRRNTGRHNKTAENRLYKGGSKRQHNRLHSEAIRWRCSRRSCRIVHVDRSPCTMATLWPPLCELHVPQMVLRFCIAKKPRKNCVQRASMQTTLHFDIQRYLWPCSANKLQISFYRDSFWFKWTIAAWRQVRTLIYILALKTPLKTKINLQIIYEDSFVP